MVRDEKNRRKIPYVFKCFTVRVISPENLLCCREIEIWIERERFFKRRESRHLTI